MAGTSINCLAIVLKELGWSYTRLIAELRRQAAIDGAVLPKTESLIRLISRWVTKENESSWIFEPRLTCSNALRRVQNPGFSLVTTISSPTTSTETC